jgi:hypothetical protein
MVNELLSFQKGNSKLGKSIYTFSLPSGYTCPFAKDCLAKVNRLTGKLTDGPHTQFRCFSASQEALFPSVRKSRWDNFEKVKNAIKNNTLVDLILNSIPKKATIIRVHVAGDYYNQVYFNAWMEVAKRLPSVTFYAYTKSIGYWINQLGNIPSNFKLNASYGGKQDNLIEQYNLKYAKVVFSVEQAGNLKIDHDDTSAYMRDESFCLLIHNTQPKGSEASKALSKLRKLGIGGYGKQKKDRELAVA